MMSDFGGWAALIISIIVTAGFIPNMLRKGALDLYVAKPIGRVPLLLYKYIGGLLYVAFLAAFTVGGIWLLVGLRYNVWSMQFLLVIPVLIYYFAILYAISTFIAVFTRSMLVAILVTIVVWGIVFGIGFGHEAVTEINSEVKKNLVEVRKQQGDDVNPEELERVQPVPDWVEGLLLGLRKIAPRTYDLDKLSGRMIADGVLTESEYKEKYEEELDFGWTEVLIVSFIQILILLGLASWRIQTRDG